MKKQSVWRRALFLLVCGMTSVTSLSVQRAHSAESPVWGALSHPLQMAAASASITPEAAIKKALEVAPGRVLSVTPKQRNNRSVYQVKVLVSGGRVVLVSIDARTGEVAP